MYSRVVVVELEQGLHARPATEFVNEAQKFQSTVTVRKNAHSVDAKSILGLMSLAIAAKSEIEIAADGQDEEAAVAALCELVTRGSHHA
jgi:phosphotransferase system HPr (HPr) family protein